MRGVDDPKNPIHAIVSVMMLREGWDVQNVTVVVGLRPYSAKANILPEQAIGRGLRLMFRDLTSDYTERVDIIGNQKFLDFVDDLEKLEELQFDTFEIGKDKLRILTIMPTGGTQAVRHRIAAAHSHAGAKEKLSGRNCRAGCDVVPNYSAAAHGR